MDHTASPHFSSTSAPTSSTDPGQQRTPATPAPTDTRNITAQDTVSTGQDGLPGTHADRTDGPKNPDPDSLHASGAPSGQAGTEYNTHMKGTAAPGSHSELFGLSPGEGKVHAPPGSGPGSGVIGTTGHKGSMNVGSGVGTGGGVGAGAEGNVAGKPSLMDKLNPMTDTDGDGKRGIGQ